MSTDVDIRALAKLAKLAISETEVTKLQEEIPGILAFVQTIQNADVSTAPVSNDLRNVMRSDEDAHESGMYTEILLKAAPARVGDRFAVKQVVSRIKKQ